MLQRFVSGLRSLEPAAALWLALLRTCYGDYYYASSLVVLELISSRLQNSFHCDLNAAIALQICDFQRCHAHLEVFLERNLQRIVRVDLRDDRHLRYWCHRCWLSINALSSGWRLLRKGFCQGGLCNADIII